MNFFYFFTIFITCCICSLTNQAKAGEDLKIYISAQDVQVTDCGLFVHVDDEFFPVDGIYVDVLGLYINSIDANKNEEITDQCPNGHKIYHRECQGCANWWCNFRCKCYSPWGKY